MTTIDQHETVVPILRKMSLQMGKGLAYIVWAFAVLCLMSLAGAGMAVALVFGLTFWIWFPYGIYYLAATAATALGYQGEDIGICVLFFVVSALYGATLVDI